MKPIRLSGHARLRIRQRGATELEVAETIRESSWVEAGQGRKECQKDFIFGREWNRQVCATRRVRIFVEKQQEILVVTVYVYYF